MSPLEPFKRRESLEDHQSISKESPSKGRVDSYQFRLNRFGCSSQHCNGAGLPIPAAVAAVVVAAVVVAAVVAAVVVAVVAAAVVIGANQQDQQQEVKHARLNTLINETLLLSPIFCDLRRPPPSPPPSPPLPPSPPSPPPPTSGSINWPVVIDRSLSMQQPLVNCCRFECNQTFIAIATSPLPPSFSLLFIRFGFIVVFVFFLSIFPHFTSPSHYQPPAAISVQS